MPAGVDRPSIDNAEYAILWICFFGGKVFIIFGVESVIDDRDLVTVTVSQDICKRFRDGGDEIGFFHPKMGRRFVLDVAMLSMMVLEE